MWINTLIGWTGQKGNYMTKLSFGRIQIIRIGVQIIEETIPLIGMTEAGGLTRPAA